MSTPNREDPDGPEPQPGSMPGPELRLVGHEPELGAVGHEPELGVVGLELELGEHELELGEHDPELEMVGREPELELIGQVVGEYVVEGKLGSGAFGTVYKGVHPLIGKAVAIKVLSRRFSVDPEMVSRFVSEARAVNQIRHRNIIDIFSFGQLEDGRHYYVMEYLEGETLQALLDREHRVSPARCLAIVRAIGRALDAAHAKGIAHRDLKAENIFLGTDADGGEWPKLLDFGIAKLTSSEDRFAHKTRSGVSIGTPRYMSPEQCYGRQVDHRTDIYAFGILVYLMLTGGFPFDGDSSMEILMQQVGSAAVPPSAHVPDLPEAIDDVVLWLVHKDPARRPPDLKTAMIVFEQAAGRAGLLGPAAQSSAWELISAASSTQPAKAVVADRSDPDGAGTSAEGAQLRRAPIVAVASLVAITAIVAATVAVYPRSDAAQLPARPGGPAQLAGQRPAQLAGQGPAQLAVQGLAQLAGPGPALVRGSSSARVPEDLAAPADSPVTLTIEGVPAGTEIIAGGRRLGVAPGPVQLPHGGAPLALTFQASGYAPATRSIVPDRDQALSLTLARQPPRPGPRGGRRPTRDDIIDVFGGDAP